MAIDKAIDSTQLDHSLAYSAARIRAKTGNSSQIPFDLENEKGFGDAIDAIPSGGGYRNGISGVAGGICIGIDQGTFSSFVVEDDVVVNFPDHRILLTRFLQGATLAAGVSEKKLTINCKGFRVSQSLKPGMANICYRSPAINEVEFNCSDDDYVILGTQCFCGNGTGSQKCAVETITGTPLALTGYYGATYTCFAGNVYIKDMRFYEHLSDQTITFSSCSALSDATLVSIANALSDNEGSATLTLHATPKARLSSIMGTVSTVTRGAETYSKFTADAQGTVTLQDFITTTKGWTLA